MQRYTQANTHPHILTCRYIHAGIQAGRQAYIRTHIQAYINTCIHTDWQAVRQTGIHTGRRPDHTCIHIC